MRSYARYLGLDPDEVFHRFCQESGFVRQPAARRRPEAAGAARRRPLPGGFRPDFPLARLQRAGCREIPLSAIGSVLVLVALLVGLGYGGWTVLQNIQRVQFAPVEELPLAVAEVDPLAAPEAPALDEPALSELASPVAATALADLYRQQELEVPILVPRDGPIAALDPDRDRPARRLRAAPAPRRRGGRRGRRRRCSGRRRCQASDAAAAGDGGAVDAAAAGGRRRARRLDPGLPGERHGHLRAHPREGRDLLAARGDRARR